MTGEAEATDGGDVDAGPVIAIAPPPPALRASVAGLIVEIWRGGRSRTSASSPTTTTTHHPGSHAYLVGSIAP